MEIPGLISLPTLLISIQTIPFLESSLIPSPVQITIPRSIPETILIPEPIPILELRKLVQLLEELLVHNSFNDCKGNNISKTEFVQFP